MHIVCTICSDLVNNSENINVTKCGHVFHFHCLSEWISRSKTCPQCRNRVTDSCMFRMYPTISEASQGGDDATTLQAKLDDVHLQLREKKKLEKEYLMNLASTNERLKQNIELLKLAEESLVIKESSITALKKRIEYINLQKLDAKKLKEEKTELETKLNLLNNVQRALESSAEEVEVMMHGCSDLRTLVTMATALKKALCDSENKKTELRKTIQSMKTQLDNERNVRASLQKMVEKLKNRIKLRVDDSLDEAVTGSSVGLGTPVKTTSVDDPIKIVPNPTTFVKSPVLGGAESSSSPYLQLQQGSALLNVWQHRNRNTLLKRQTVKSPEFGILRQKVVKLADMSSSGSSSECANYDGLGGRRARSPTLPTRVAPPPRKHRLAPPTRPLNNRNISTMLAKKPRHD